MIKHTVTIEFAADAGVGFDAVIDSFGNAISAAHGYGINVTHTAAHETDSVCCIRDCGKPATRQLGAGVFFPFCETHYAATR